MEHGCTVVYGFGNITIGLNYNLPDEQISADSVYSDFVVDHVPKLVINCYFGNLPELGLTENDLVFQSSSLWSVYRRNNNENIISLKLIDAPSPYLLAIFDEHFKLGTIHREIPEYLTSGAGKLPSCFEYPLGPVILMCITSKGVGLIVHACGVDAEGKGLLFVGSSQAGKTTTARLWGNHGRILTDDRVLLYRDGNEFKICGLPWHGEFPFISARPVTLNNILFLRKSPKNEVERLDISTASMLLFQQSSVPPWDKTAIGASLEFINDLLTQVPSYSLGTLPDESAVDFVRCID
jgi:hypothetical protein